MPLALFGPERYPVLMGRLAFPSLIVQALAPSAAAFLLEGYGADATIAVLTAFALVNVVLIAALWAACRRTIVARVTPVTLRCRAVNLSRRSPTNATF